MSAKSHPKSHWFAALKWTGAKGGRNRAIAYLVCPCPFIVFYRLWVLNLDVLFYCCEVCKVVLALAEWSGKSAWILGLAEQKKALCMWGCFFSFQQDNSNNQKGHYISQKEPIYKLHTHVHLWHLKHIHTHKFHIKDITKSCCLYQDVTFTLNYFGYTLAWIQGEFIK